MLLPGMLGSALEWSLFRQDARRYGILAMDLPRGGTLLDMAAVLVPRLPPEPVTVVGASLGGLVGLSLATLVPGKVRRVVTVGTLPDPRGMPRHIRVVARMAAWVGASAFDVAYRAHVSRSLGRNQVGGLLRRQLVARAPARDVWVERVRAIEAWGLPEVLDVPVVRVLGDHEPSAWVAHFGAGAVRVPGGHFPHISHPAALWALLLKLEGQDGVEI